MISLSSLMKNCIEKISLDLPPEIVNSSIFRTSMNTQELTVDTNELFFVPLKVSMTSMQSDCMSDEIEVAVSASCPSSLDPNEMATERAMDILYIIRLLLIIKQSEFRRYIHDLGMNAVDPSPITVNTEQGSIFCGSAMFTFNINRRYQAADTNVPVTEFVKNLYRENEDATTVLLESKTITPPGD